MTTLQIIAMIFIAYEIAKVIFSKKIFEIIKHQYLTQKANRYVFFIDTFYIIFLGVLLFTQWWKVSISMIFISIIMIFSLFPLVKNNETYGWKVLSLTVVDCVVSIFLLSRLFV